LNQQDHETEIEELNRPGKVFAEVEAVDGEDTDEQPEQEQGQLLLVTNQFHREFCVAFAVCLYGNYPSALISLPRCIFDNWLPLNMHNVARQHG
jgi:hypothetical protein